MKTLSGIVSHYFDKIGVAAITLTKKGIKVGDTIKFAGHGHEFSQPVDSMQIDHKVVTRAKKGDSIGIKVNEKVHEKDKVYLVN